MALTAEAQAGGEIQLHDIMDGESHRVMPRRLVIAGFTGRDQRAVEAHLDELRKLGVPVPDSTPAFYELAPNLVTASEEILVTGDFTSGEVEPVVVVSGETWLLSVGSDHTDRTLERTSIRHGKEACPKIISEQCVRLDLIEEWDALELESWLDDAPESYQVGTLGELLPLDEIVRRLDLAGISLSDGDVLFLGTVPVVVDGGLRPSARFTGALGIPEHDRTLNVSYGVRSRS